MSARYNPHSHGRRPREELGGRTPKIWGGGTAHASVPPNILRSSVCGRCAQKHEQSTTSVIKELFSEIGAFLVKKGSYTTLHTVKTWKFWIKKGKILKTWSMSKMEKRHSVCEIFFRPPKLGARSLPMLTVLFCSRCRSMGNNDAWYSPAQTMMP